MKKSSSRREWELQASLVEIMIETSIDKHLDEYDIPE